MGKGKRTESEVFCSFYLDHLGVLEIPLQRSYPGPLNQFKGEWFGNKMSLVS